MNTGRDRKKIKELTEEIQSLKSDLTAKNVFMSNADTFAALDRIGELVSERNELTGEESDEQYLYLDDGEWQREVIGFVGDPSGMTDINQIPLMIGDTVGMQQGDGHLYPRLVALSVMNQNSINESNAIKLKDYAELDMKDAFSAAFTISLHSCIEGYEQTQKHEMGMNL